MEARDGIEPSCRSALQTAARASENRTMASPARFERVTSWSGTTRAVLLRYGDVKCAGMDLNHRTRGT